MPAITLLESDIAILNHSLAFAFSFHPCSWKDWHSWWIATLHEIQRMTSSPCYRQERQSMLTKRCADMWHLLPTPKVPEGAVQQENHCSHSRIYCSFRLLQLSWKTPQPISAQTSGPCLRGWWVNLCNSIWIQVHSESSSGCFASGKDG